MVVKKHLSIITNLRPLLSTALLGTLTLAACSRSAPANVYRSPPVVVTPPEVIVAAPPPVVYAQPPVVYVTPEPVYVSPDPVVVVEPQLVVPVLVGGGGHDGPARNDDHRDDRGH
jgi:hypothetical protein